MASRLPPALHRMIERAQGRSDAQTRAYEDAQFAHFFSAWTLEGPDAAQARAQTYDFAALVGARLHPVDGGKSAVRKFLCTSPEAAELRMDLAAMAQLVDIERDHPRTPHQMFSRHSDEQLLPVRWQDTPEALRSKLLQSYEDFVTAAGLLDESVFHDDSERRAMLGFVTEAPVVSPSTPSLDEIQAVAVGRGPSAAEIQAPTRGIPSAAIIAAEALTSSESAELDVASFRPKSVATQLLASQLSTLGVIGGHDQRAADDIMVAADKRLAAVAGGDDRNLPGAQKLTGRVKAYLDGEAKATSVSLPRADYGRASEIYLLASPTLANQAARLAVDALAQRRAEANVWSQRKAIRKGIGGVDPTRDAYRHLREIVQISDELSIAAVEAIEREKGDPSADPRYEAAVVALWGKAIATVNSFANYALTDKQVNSYLAPVSEVFTALEALDSHQLIAQRGITGDLVHAVDLNSTGKRLSRDLFGIAAESGFEFRLHELAKSARWQLESDPQQLMLAGSPEPFTVTVVDAPGRDSGMEL